MATYPTSKSTKNEILIAHDGLLK